LKNVIEPGFSSDFQSPATGPFCKKSDGGHALLRLPRQARIEA
jgi:hypothetical protein